MFTNETKVSGLTVLLNTTSSKVSQPRAIDGFACDVMAAMLVYRSNNMSVNKTKESLFTQFAQKWKLTLCKLCEQTFFCFCTPTCKPLIVVM